LRVFLALVLAALFVFPLIVPRKKPTAHIRELNEYGFKLPYLAPIGFRLAAVIPPDFNPRYETRVKGKLAELYGRREVAGFYKIHWGQRVVLVVSVGFSLILVSLLGEVDFAFFVFGLAIVALVFYWADRELDKKLRIKKREILIDLPELLNTITLLVNAGLPLSVALQKAVRGRENRGPLYKEMTLLLVEIEAGKPISQAYEDLAQRCKVPEVTRFVSTVLQNLTRGSADLVHVLRTLTLDAWERRKDIARKQGEEASSKLVVPMVMVFVAVAIIVMAPAVITMSR